jgi:hypothetical protein
MQITVVPYNTDHASRDQNLNNGKETKHEMGSGSQYPLPAARAARAARPPPLAATTRSAHITFSERFSGASGCCKGIAGVCSGWIEVWFKLLIGASEAVCRHTLWSVRRLQMASMVPSTCVPHAASIPFALVLHTFTQLSDDVTAPCSWVLYVGGKNALAAVFICDILLQIQQCLFCLILVLFSLRRSCDD